jgi:hypothetical protein
LSASSWAGAVSFPGSPFESPTRPRGALEQSSSSASSARSPPARCARLSIRRRATPSGGARGPPGSWRSRSSAPFDGASPRREPVRVLERRRTRARAGASTGAQRRGHRAATTSTGSLAARAAVRRHRRSYLSSTCALPSSSSSSPRRGVQVFEPVSTCSAGAGATRFVRPGRGRELEGLALLSVVYTYRTVANAKLTAFRLTEADRAYLDTLEDKLGFSKTDVVRLALRRLAELEGLELIKKSDPRRPARRV